jgi:hypothetical protein
MISTLYRMCIMRRRARKSKIKRKALILMVVAAAIIITVIAAIKNPNNPKKPLASEYLKVEHTKSLGEFYNNNRTVKIIDLGLRVTALCGDAHNILITNLPIGSGDLQPYIQYLRIGEYKDLDITLDYLTSLNEDGLFPLELTIGCSEAEPEDVTIFLKPEDIIGPHY